MLRGTLFDRLRDERESVRRRALDLLSQGSLGSAEAPILARCLGDPAPSVRARAALALMRGGGPFNRRGNRPEPIVAPSALVSALVDGLRDEQESVRVQAAQSRDRPSRSETPSATPFPRSRSPCRTSRCASPPRTPSGVSSSS